jgi:hypothetical protein
LYPFFHCFMFYCNMTMYIVSTFVLWVYDCSMYYCTITIQYIRLHLLWLGIVCTIVPWLNSMYYCTMTVLYVLLYHNCMLCTILLLWLCSLTKFKIGIHLCESLPDRYFSNNNWVLDDYLSCQDADDLTERTVLRKDQYWVFYNYVRDGGFHLICWICSATWCFVCSKVDEE